MEWYNVLAIVLGALGGTAGLVGLYKAKSEKKGIDIDNMQKMLEEAHKMYDDARNETKELREEFSEYKKENMEYVADFKRRFAKIEGQLEKTELAVYQGYRCPFPPKTAECPVLKEYEKHCEECIASVEK
jgi:esterase/lipase